MANKEYIYADGNTVRKKRYKKRRRLSPREQQKLRQIRRQREFEAEIAFRERNRRVSNLKPISFHLTFLFFVATVCTLFLLIQYLNLRIETDAVLRNIRHKENVLENLKEENRTIENNLNTSVDLNKLFKIAVEDLGMVYPDEDHIITFEKTEHGYVRQYEDIPN